MKMDNILTGRQQEQPPTNWREPMRVSGTFRLQPDNGLGGKHRDILEPGPGLGNNHTQPEEVVQHTSR